LEPIKENISTTEEQVAIKGIVRNAIYICMHLKSAKALFDPLGTDYLCASGICIADISDSPISFVVEEEKTKSYIYYNSKLSKVKYACNSDAALNMLASGIEGMKLQLDSRLDEEMKDMTAEIKEMILKKVEREVAMINMR